MAERPVWRGHLRLALVSCPVTLHGTRRTSGNLHFHLINPKTGNRIRMVTQDAETGKDLQRGDLVKGYEFEKGRYVLLDEEDFESARIESSSTMTIGKFVAQDAIDAIWFDNSYYMVPDGDAGDDVFVVLREAMERTGQIALSRLVMSRRERAVAIRPMQQGMILHTLHEPRDMYDAGTVFDNIPDLKPDTEMVKLATQLIERQTAKFEPDDTEDRYESRLRDVIDAKLRGEGIEPAPQEEDRGNVIDLMAALKKSLGQGADSSKSATRSRGGSAKTNTREAETKPAGRKTAARPTKRARRA